MDQTAVRQQMKYPHSEEIMTPGDVLYSSKGWSTFLVGHVAIVGPDMRIYHSHPKGAFADSWKGYVSRHKYGGTMTVYRPKKGAMEIAAWAASNYSIVQRYIFHPTLQNIKNNYCTKFVWQAFWFTDQGDLTNRGLTGRHRNWIYPYEMKKSHLLREVVRIKL
ncbi:hypothetical protein NC661_10870 [Aquibacillus koreensis]|uniref:Permuted papain-like amidase enzyme, YaeF/YiiX, C92 family n=1 Tax=Aquibacillus koreensis TaxID=279446 RepID=A0A9X3WJF1_9BACI|nr:hypothetical protein [Aquibacillus koreensis]MCT2538184.1 hypothetical protein [Aquibacillus koreensis]MDC3420872.1 hypothetical protein [Aquibacillus koreensis]